MDVFYITTLSILLGLLTALWYYYTRKSSNTDLPTIILFIDAPDPDNPAAALALYKYYYQQLMKGPLHIVITGRPVNLRTQLLINKNISQTSIKRQSWESHNIEHSQKLLQDSAARISNYLDKCGIDVKNNIIIYNGNIAPSAPISDAVHDWDFLFDRKDLLTSLTSDQGEILTHLQYMNLVYKYNQLSDDERERQLLKLLRDYQLHSLESLSSVLANKSCHEIHIYLGGPVTALPQLFNDSNSYKVTKLYGMFGALNPGKGTILDNQFNVACDMESTAKVFIENGGMFSRVTNHLITTETCKQKPLIITSCQLKEIGAYPHIVALQELWECLHNGKPQPLFDVLPIMASLDKYKLCFSWFKKKPIITEGKFYLIDSNDTGTLMTSCDYLSTREQFLEFLTKLWN